jgi:6-phosphogluconolactonase
MDDAISGFACASTDDERGGIYGCDLDASSGRLDLGGQAPVPGAMYLAVGPDGGYLYAVSSEGESDIRTFRIDDDSGGLTELNRQSEGVEGPAYVSVDGRGRYVFVANYFGGSVSAFPVEADGRLGAPTDTVEHEGSSVDGNRQTEPHPHSIVPGPADRYVYAPDLGTDRIEIYEVDNEGHLRPADAPPAELHPGAGPRHLTFHPDEAVAYVINELNATITTFEHDPGTGALDAVETVETLPSAYDGDNLCADIHVHPSGDYLYGSNRGHDSIAVFEVDEAGGLEPVGHATDGIDWPRHFAIDPTGSILLVENQHGDSIVTFEIDGATGELTPTGHRVDVPAPLCFQFL